MEHLKSVLKECHSIAAPSKNLQISTFQDKISTSVCAKLDEKNLDLND